MPTRKQSLSTKRANSVFNRLKRSLTTSSHSGSIPADFTIEHPANLAIVGSDDSAKAKLTCEIINGFAKFDLYSAQDVLNMKEIQQKLHDNKKGLMDVINFKFMPCDIEEVSPFTYKSHMSEADCFLVIGSFTCLEFQEYVNNILKDIVTMRKTGNVPLTLVNTDEQLSETIVFLDIDTSLFDVVRYGAVAMDGATRSGMREILVDEMDKYIQEEYTELSKSDELSYS